MGSRRPIVNVVGGEAQLLQLLPAQAISSLLRRVNVHLREGNMEESQEQEQEQEQEHRDIEEVA